MKKAERLTVRNIPVVRMDCPTCIPLLEREVARLNGVYEVRGNYMARTLRVTYDSTTISVSEIESAIERLGYQVTYKKYPSVASRLKGLFKKKKPYSVQVLSDTDFQDKVLHSPKPVAVLFSSPKCPICKMVEPVFLESAKALESEADFYQMDVTSSETWHHYEILGIPAILIFEEGKVKDRLSSLPKKDQIQKALQS